MTEGENKNGYIDKLTIIFFNWKRYSEALKIIIEKD